ncbi:MAG TPA: HipA domain-containing protein [Flavipsychrobacter sp.]|nr:HipA domain-containing protein [Flavipsychrobacter sp.]
METLKVCPSTLHPGYETYSTTALRHLFYGRKVSHQLNFSLSEAHKEQRKQLKENRTKISISGVQEKYSLKLNKRTLELTDAMGEYILKPIPKDLENVAFVPANEHLTMQIAAQVYKMDVAKNALIFFSDGELAYITKRFDVMPDGKRCLKEDFASLLQKTSETDGKNFKYEGSYDKMANTIDKLLPAPMIAKENLFKQIVFNYLFGNGDAHLKNFSVVDYYQDGLYQLSPAYDLICTRLHIDDSDFALHDGLYENDFKHPSYAHYGFYGYDDLYDFGLKIGLLPKRISGFMQNFLAHDQKVVSLIARSFLSEELKEHYEQLYLDKLKRLKTSLAGKIA